MKKSNLYVTIITTFLVLFIGTGTSWSHGGGHGPATTSPPIPEVTQENPVTTHEGHHAEGSSEADAGEPSTYGAMEMENEDMEGEGTYGIESDQGLEDHSGHEGMMSSSDPGLFEDPLVEMETEASSIQHEEGHSMTSHEQHVEPTSFEKVSSDAPGHSMAVGLTVFAGLTFGLLTLIRPFEK